MPKKILVKETIRCPGMNSKRMDIERPMKATLFVNKDPRYTVAVLYTETGHKLGTFGLEGLDALRVAAKVARNRLVKLIATQGRDGGVHGTK